MKKCSLCDQEKEEAEFREYDICYSCGQEQIEWMKTQVYDYVNDR